MRLVDAADFGPVCDSWRIGLHNFGDRPCGVEDQP